MSYVRGEDFVVWEWVDQGDAFTGIVSLDYVIFEGRL